MNTTMLRSLAYGPLLTRARRALAALVLGALVALAAGCEAGALAAPPAAALRGEAARAQVHPCAPRLAEHPWRMAGCTPGAA